MNKKQVVKRTKHRANARYTREAGGGRQRDSFPQARWVLGEAHFSNLAIRNTNKKQEDYIHPRSGYNNSEF
jgi:hypothetical protein